jgi:hypothetical protein
MDGIATQVGMIGGVDADILAFAATTGATDLGGLSKLATYLKAQGIWANSICFPMRSTQNFPSGSTVKSFGGFAGGDMTLYNSPTWTVAGIQLNGTTQYGLTGDVVNGGTLNVFSRNFISVSSPGSGTRAILSQYGGSADRGFNLGYSYDASTGTRMFRSSDGSGAAQEAYQTGTNSIGGLDACLSAEWVDGGGRSLRINKSDTTLSIFGTTSAQTSMYNSSLQMCFGAIFAPPSTLSGHNSLTGIAQLIVRSSLTTVQRDAITDLINAL